MIINVQLPFFHAIFLSNYCGQPQMAEEIHVSQSIAPVNICQVIKIAVASRAHENYSHIYVAGQTSSVTSFKLECILVPIMSWFFSDDPIVISSYFPTAQTEPLSVFPSMPRGAFFLYLD